MSERGTRENSLERPSGSNRGEPLQGEKNSDYPRGGTQADGTTDAPHGTATSNGINQATESSDANEIRDRASDRTTARNSVSQRSGRRHRRPSRSRSRSNGRRIGRYHTPSRSTSRRRRDRMDSYDDSREARRERRRRRTGWDDAPQNEGPDDDETCGSASSAGGGLIGFSGTSSSDPAKTLAEIEQELQERQVQAANIAAVMQTKASLSQMCRIYVGSLDYSLVESDIRSVFTAFGTIVNIDMPKEGARSKGFCFVEYTSPEAAEMALTTMQGFVLKGRSIKVGRPTALGGQTQTSAPMSSLGALGASNADAAQAGALAAASLIASRPAGAVADGAQSAAALLASSSLGALQQQQSQQNRVYVGSVPYSFTAEDVKQIFQVFGPILSCQLIPSNERPGTHRGYGFIEYQTQDQAKLSIDTMNNFEVGGKQLKVNYATALRNQQSPGMPLGLGGLSPTTLLGLGAATTPPAAATGANAVAIPQPPGMMGIPPSPPELDMMCQPQQQHMTSPIIVLTNMVSPEEVDQDLNEELRQECSKYGNILDVKIQIIGTEVRIFVHFASYEEAAGAVPQLHGRFFAGRQIFCRQYEMGAYAAENYTL